jgi:hypothetical protein
VADSPFIFDDFKEQLKYLTDRGIDELTTKRLGLEVKTASWLHEQGFPKVPGLSRGIVWRLRDLRGVETNKLGAKVFYQKGIIGDAGKPKFLPPKGQVPGIYYTPLANWDKLTYGQRIYICESYLKADICGMLGFHAIGVSGCWGWSHGKELLWDFKDLPWRDEGLLPVVCMDSDVNPDNPKLYNAARKFNAEMSVRCGVHAEIIVLPGEAKRGLDDYYVSEGKAATVSLLEGESEPLPDALTDHLKIMATEVCFVRDMARFVEIESGIIMTRGDFENATYANRQIWNDDGKPIPVAKTYTKWDSRTEVKELVYRPGKERLVVPDYYNFWEGMGVAPMAADVSLFLDWVQTVFVPTEADYFLDWWGWQLQNLGGKLSTALVVVGAPGVGKGWITAIFEQIYGVSNVSKIPLTVLERHFNADVAAKQLMIVEETDEVGKNSNMIYNKLKDMITSTTIRLEKKGMDAYLIDNTVNCFLTGNQIGIFKLDADDRRFACLDASNESKLANDPAYWDPRWAWLASGGGASAIYGYLLRRDLRDFNPHGQAPMTTAKRDMIEITHTPLDSWVRDLIADPESVLVAGHSEVDGLIATARELCWLYHEGKYTMREVDRKMVNEMNRALKNARVPVANDGKKIKPTGGASATYFGIRPLPERPPSWSAIVKDRLFWQRLADSEMNGVASGQDKVASSDKY